MYQHTPLLEFAVGTHSVSLAHISSGRQSPLILGNARGMNGKRRAVQIKIPSWPCRPVRVVEFAPRLVGGRPGLPAHGRHTISSTSVRAHGMIRRHRRPSKRLGQSLDHSAVGSLRSDRRNVTAPRGGRDSADGLLPVRPRRGTISRETGRIAAMVDLVVRGDTVVTPQGVGAYDIAHRRRADRRGRRERQPAGAGRRAADRRHGQDRHARRHRSARALQVAPAQSRRQRGTDRTAGRGRARRGAWRHHHDDRLHPCQPGRQRAGRDRAARGGLEGPLRLRLRAAHHGGRRAAAGPAGAVGAKRSRPASRR